MKIFIITMDDPIYTRSFIEDIVKERHQDVVGMVVAEGDRLKISKKKSKIEYLISLLLIMGVYNFARNSVKTLYFKAKREASTILPFVSSPSILSVANKYGIPAWRIESPNDPAFLDKVRQESPDVIINQSQSILKKELLEIPRIGVLNRHNALLPKNRGRLTPFWVLYKEEKRTGVSIHFVDEGIDSGEIIVQREFPITDDDDFNSVVKKNYEIASLAMLEALNKLEHNGKENLISNDDSKATYNGVPSLKDAFDFRVRRLRRFFA